MPLPHKLVINNPVIINDIINPCNNTFNFILSYKYPNINLPREFIKQYIVSIIDIKLSSFKFFNKISLIVKIRRLSKQYNR